MGIGPPTATHIAHPSPQEPRSTQRYAFRNREPYMMLP